jgi:hypothetical protein
MTKCGKESKYFRKISRFEAGKVSEKKPIPTGHHNIFRLDVSVANLR